MSKKDQARIDAFLDSQKINERKLGAYKPKFYEAMKQALDDNRMGNKTAVRHQIRSIVSSLRVVHVLKEERVADFSKALAKFISKYGHFDFGKVLAKNASKLRGITTMFHSKGVLAAKKEGERLYKVMVDAGEIPAGASMADFEAAMEYYDVHAIRYYNFNEQAIGKANWNSIIKGFKLKNGAKKDLKKLGMAIYKKGSKHQVVQAMASDILAVSGDSKAARHGVHGFVSLVADELVTAGAK
ncbi:hypothetical protein [uncultured Tateyamaria sp.]|uniref:hypothetical protein n=1 Tax=uncultured Tateyamaria sp. TaxID=455651 RepID=UPI00262265FA|nr:hypothetical protein [uncultured Tateyamaria sp.]